MSKRVIRLTESELKSYIRKVVSEQATNGTQTKLSNPASSLNWDKVVNFLKTTGYNGYKFKKFTEGNPKLGITLTAKSDQKPFRELNMTFFPDGKWHSSRSDGNANSKHEETYSGLQAGTWSWNQEDNGGRGSLMTKVTTNFNPNASTGLNEQGSFNPTNVNGDDDTPKETGEPIVPYEKKGPSVPTSSISPEDLAKSIAGIAKGQEGMKFLKYIGQWGHTSKESWDACMKGKYYPYTSPELRKKAERGGYFPFPNMASKRAYDAKRSNNRPSMRRTPPPQQTFRINPTLSFDQNVYLIQQQIRRDLTPKEKSQIDKAMTDAKTRASLYPTPQQDQLIAQRVQQLQQQLRRNVTQIEVDRIKSEVMNQLPLSKRTKFN